MKVVGRKVLIDFSRRHADVASQITSWLYEADEAEWRSPTDVKARYPHASILPGDRVVFNLKGNNYRLVVRINYGAQLVLVERMGTHAEYSKWNL